jgi:hypothetical protein
MFSKAKKILASELMYARNLSEDDANLFLDGILGEVNGGQVPPTIPVEPQVASVS